MAPAYQDPGSEQSRPAAAAPDDPPPPVNLLASRRPRTRPTDAPRNTNLHVTSSEAPPFAGAGATPPANAAPRRFDRVLRETSDPFFHVHARHQPHARYSMKHTDEGHAEPHAPGPLVSSPEQQRRHPA